MEEDEKNYGFLGYDDLWDDYVFWDQNPELENKEKEKKVCPKCFGKKRYLLLNFWHDCDLCNKKEKKKK